MSLRIKRRRRSERGAVTVLFAILVVVLFAVAALGVDIAQQVNRKHLLINQLDSAATAAAAKLGAENGSIAAAVAAAADYFANSGQGELDLDKIDFWCVVARKLNGDNTPFNPPGSPTAQIPTPTQAGGVCNPDAVGGEDGKWCAVPLPEPCPVLGRPTVHDVVQRHPLRGARAPSRPRRATAGTRATRRTTTGRSRATPSGSAPSRTSRSRSRGRWASTRGPPAPRSRSRAPDRAAPSPRTRWTWSSSPTAPCR